MLRGPGKYMVVMTWWILVLFFATLCRYSLLDYLSSYLVFFIAFAFTLGVGILLNLFESTLNLWPKTKRWGRFIIMNTAYTVAIGASLIVTIRLDSFGVVAYFGGDSAGSFALLYLPSIVFYWVVGATVCGTISVAEALKRRDRTRT